MSSPTLRFDGDDLDFDLFPTDDTSFASFADSHPDASMVHMGPQVLASAPQHLMEAPSHMEPFPSQYHTSSSGTQHGHHSHSATQHGHHNHSGTQHGTQHGSHGTQHGTQHGSHSHSGPPANYPYYQAHLPAPVPGAPAQHPGAPSHPDHMDLEQATPASSLNTSFSSLEPAPSQPSVTPRRPQRKSVSSHQTQTPTATMRVSPVNLANAAKVTKQPHHQRSRSRISVDLNTTITTPLMPSVPFSPSGSASTAPAGYDDVTPLPTPTSNLNCAPPLAFSAKTTPYALNRADTLESIKIEDQDDDAFKQLKKAKSYSSFTKARPQVVHQPDDFSAVSTPGFFADNSPIHFDQASQVHHQVMAHAQQQAAHQQQAARARKPPVDLLGQFEFEGDGELTELLPPMATFSTANSSASSMSSSFSSLHQAASGPSGAPYGGQFVVPGSNQSLNGTAGSAMASGMASGGQGVSTGPLVSTGSLVQSTGPLVQNSAPAGSGAQYEAFPPIQEYEEQRQYLREVTPPNFGPEPYPRQQLASGFAPSGYEPGYQRYHQVYQDAYPEAPDELGAMAPLTARSRSGSSRQGSTPSVVSSLASRHGSTSAPSLKKSKSAVALAMDTTDMPKSVASALMAPDFSVDIPVVKSNRSDKSEQVDPKKKHKCPICDSRFQRPEHVKRHLKSHSSEKPFQCEEPNCGKRFNRKDNLKAHLKKIHHRKDL
ncbi:hypothetical protein DICA1_E30856 [Diutina catenulata]